MLTLYYLILVKMKSLSFEVARNADGAIKRMASGHSSDFKSLDRTKHQPYAIVEVIVDTVSHIIVVDRMALAVYSDRVAKCSSPSFVAITNQRRYI